MADATGSKHCVVLVYGTLLTHCGLSYKIKSDGVFVVSGKYRISGSFFFNQSSFFVS